MEKIKNTNTDHDNAWKVIIKALFIQFLAFFLPALYKKVDFKKGYTFLDKELAELLRFGKKGEQTGDLLVKIWLKNGNEIYFLIHIEIQSYFKKRFPEYMFISQYRIWDRHKADVEALAIFTGKNVMPDYYERKTGFGTRVFYKYNSYIVNKQDDEELLKSNNIFALVVLAAKHAINTKNEQEYRYQFTRKLINLLKEKAYSDDEIRNLFIFMNEILKLGELYSVKFDKNV